jgi:hypothetical protein
MFKAHSDTYSNVYQRQLTSMSGIWHSIVIVDFSHAPDLDVLDRQATNKDRHFDKDVICNDEKEADGYRFFLSNRSKSYM